MEPDPLMLRARRAYELGRLRHALELSVWVLPLTGISLLAGTAPLHAAGLAFVLFVLVTALAHRGQSLGRATTFGLAIGGAAAFLPVLARMIEPCCVGASCGLFCMPACVGGGVAAGALLGWRAAREKEQRTTFVFAAALTACIACGFGCCKMVGMGGIFGIAFGLVSSTLPVMWLRTARQR